MSYFAIFCLPVKMKPMKATKRTMARITETTATIWLIRARSR